MSDQTPEPYTPSYDEVRETVARFISKESPGAMYDRAMPTVNEGRAWFDRWLAAHDREVAERAEMAGAFKVWDLLKATGHELGPNPYTEEPQND